MSTGKLFLTPPSTRISPLERTGLKSPGMLIVERIASLKEPFVQFLAFIDTRSAATQKNGIGSSEKSILS